MPRTDHETKPVLTLDDVKRIAAAAEAEALTNSWAVTHRDRRRRRPPALAAAPGRRGAALGAHRAGEGAHRGAGAAREQGLRGHDQPGPRVVPQRAGARGHARRRRAGDRRRPVRRRRRRQRRQVDEDAQIAQAGIAALAIRQPMRGRRRPPSDIFRRFTCNHPPERTSRSFPTDQPHPPATEPGEPAKPGARTTGASACCPSCPPPSWRSQTARSFTGISIGAAGHTVGEVVFNTALTGYQEILTDPSYCRQIVTLTYPHIGNYGVNDEDVEATKVHRRRPGHQGPAAARIELPQPHDAAAVPAARGHGGDRRHRHAQADPPAAHATARRTAASSTLPAGDAVDAGARSTRPIAQRARPRRAWRASTWPRWCRSTRALRLDRDRMALGTRLRRS